MAITAIVESQVVAGATATGVLYVTSGGLLASDGPTWASNTLTVAGLLDVTAPAANDIPLSITGAAAQAGNYVNITSNGGVAGDVFKIDAAGAVTIGTSVLENTVLAMLTVKSGLRVNNNAAMVQYLHWDAHTVRSDAYIGFASSTTVPSSQGDSNFYRVSAGHIGVCGTTKATPGEFSAGDLSNSPDATGKLTRGMASETHTLSLATTSDTTTISIPSGARLLAVQMNVDTAVTDGAGDDTWSAAFVTGSTTIITNAAAAAQNTKVNLMLPDEITTGIAQIRFTPNAGSFTAGVIEMTVYYEFLTSLANA